MNRGYAELPLQQGPRRRCCTQQDPTQPTLPMFAPCAEDNQFLGLRRDPFAQRRQRCQDEQEDALAEDRPMIMKSPFTDYGKQRLTTCANEIEASKITIGDSHREIRNKVTSVYQRLLQQNDKTGERKQTLLTEATFKPRQLQRELHKNRSASHMLRGHCGNSPKSTHRNSNNSKKKTRKPAENVRKLDFQNSVPKTKYQLILEQHFSYLNKVPGRKKPTGEADRITRIYGPNSTVAKLRDRLEPGSTQFSTGTNKPSDKNESTCVEPRLRYDINRQYIREEPTYRRIHDVQPRKQGKARATQTKAKVVESKVQSDRSERWMSMDFHQRQQRVLSNRRAKQEEGKQRQIEDEIKCCTFKPFLSKSKSTKVLPVERNSYMQTYADRLCRKY